jgi:hypothetical protein
MGVYHLPDEPTGDTVWSLPRYATSPGPAAAERWDRTPDGWVHTSGAPTVTWAGLLMRGAVCDTHPGLPSEAPTPWHWDDELGVLDVHGRRVDLTTDDVADVVVRAVNAHADRLLDNTEEYR